jgi:biopolymer transport protein ExbD
MPKIKVPRKNISLDMTAMCDMAFLLLTFFMLSTKFKPQESVIVDIPSSVSEIKMPESDIMIISVEKSGAVYFGVDGQNTRIALLDKIAEKYKVTFSGSEKQEFGLTEAFGTPVRSLKSLLNVPSADRQKLEQPGIPVDSLNNELKDWVTLARLSNPKLRIAIKGDKNVNYKTVKTIIATLQSQNINKFNMITTLEM